MAGACREKSIAYPNQQTEQHNTKTDTPCNKLFFNREQRFIFHLLYFISKLRL